MMMLYVVVFVVCSICDNADRISNYIELDSYLSEVKHRDRTPAA